MRHLFLINPTAGKKPDTARIREEITRIMSQRGDPFQILETEYAGHAEELTRHAAQESGEELRIYAFGGDGTLNEVVNGAAGFDHVAVTVCPTGSGNDFIKIFTRGREGFSHLEELIDGETAVFDLVQCNDRLALNIASVGLDARVAIGMTNFKRWPLVSGKMAYILSLVTNALKGIGRTYRVTLDGERLDGAYTLLAVCNGRCYGGSFRPVPSAMPDDGRLQIVLVKAVSRLKAAQLVKEYGAGKGENYPELIHFREGGVLTVRGGRRELAQLDGEKLEAEEMTFCMSEKKLRFLYPKGAGWEPEIG